MGTGLVGDIGGTNARFALWEAGHLRAIQVLATADFPSLEQALRYYLQGQGIQPEQLEALCLACAGPVLHDEFRFTNNHWEVNRKHLQAQLGSGPLWLINDFAAMALGVTRLPSEAQQLVLPGLAQPEQVRLVIGPGTGLGVAGLLPLDNGHWRALPGEGGHVGLPLSDARDVAIWQHLCQQLDYVEAESVLCGAGLVRLYRAMCAIEGQPCVLDSAPAITAAVATGDPLAIAALDQFCWWLGQVTGDAVLTLGAQGGVYLVGGILPRFTAFFCHSRFAAGLRQQRGTMRGFLEAVPVWLVQAPYPGLLGASVALQQQLDRL